MQTISRQRMYEIIRNSPGGRWITFTAVTKPDLISPWNNIFIKVAVVKAKIKCSYVRSVNIRRRRENLPPNFQSQALPWGEWDVDFPHSPFIRKDGNLYLRVHVERIVEVHFCTHTGEIIPAQRLALLQRHRNKHKNQGLQNPVLIRTYGIDAIRRISIGGSHFRRRRLGHYAVVPV